MKGLFAVKFSVPLMLLACAAWAQNTGSISGNVTLSSGGPVANATVSLENLTSGVRQTATTDSAGAYRFDNLTGGRYRMSVATPQMTGTPSEEISLDPARPKTVNITMQGAAGANTVAPVTTAVQITESTPSLDMTTPQVTNPFNTRSIQYLPEPNYLSQSGQAFGAYNLSLMPAGVTSSGGVGLARGPVVGGQAPISNNFYIEGVDNNNRAIPGPLLYLSPDATSDFVSFQNLQPPEYGHAIGGQFNSVIKTGTNQFHGELYDYLENRNLNAVDSTFVRQGITDLPRFDQNRLGGNFGFPIIANKLFFFGDMEYIPLGFDSVPASPLLAPTAAGYSTLAGIPGLSQTNLSMLRTSIGTAQQGTQFTTIGGSRVALGQVPLLAHQYQNQYDGVGSLDWTISNSDQLRGRFAINQINANNDGAALPAFFSPLSDRAMMASVAEYHNFSPVFVTELRLGYTRFDQSLSGGGPTFPGLNFFPNIQIEQDLAAQMGPGNAVPAAMSNYNLGFNTTWTRGHHTIKFGTDDRRYIGPLSPTNLGLGSYGYSTLQGFLFNQAPDVFGARNFGAQNFPGNSYDLFAYLNDSWQVSNSFNLNLGVKYSYASLPKALLWQQFNATANVPGTLTFNEPDTQKLNFAPVVGLAFAPGFVKNTVFRAGFTMNYDTTYLQEGFPSFPPGFVSTQFVPGFGVSPFGFFGFGGFGYGIGFPVPVNVFTPSITPAEARASTTSFVGNQIVPYSMQWDSSIQTQVFHRLVLEARYMGVKTVHLPVESMLNATPRVTAAQSLPLFYSQPSQATLNSLTTSLNSLQALQNNAFASAGFTSPILTTRPQGWSWYNGLQLSARQRFSGGFQMDLNYTWSHLIDNLSGPMYGGLSGFGTANFLVTPGSSIYDHRQRATAAVMWDAGGVGKNGPNYVRDILANVVVSGVYTFESPANAFIQSGYDSLLTGGIGPGGVVANNGNFTANTGSSVTPLRNSGGQVVGYLANNPNAQFVAAAPGLFPSAARNMLQLSPINNFDAAIFKRFAVRDRFSFEVHGEAFNVFNHPQFTPAGIFGLGASGVNMMSNFVTPGAPGFGDPAMAFSSNARTMQVGLRLLF